MESFCISLPNPAISASSDIPTSFLPLPLPPLHADLIRPAPFPRTQNQPHDILHSLPVLHNRENRRSPIPHPPSIPLHNLHIRPHRLRQINLVHNQQVTPRDPRPPLPRHLIPTRHVNDIDDEIRQLPTVIRRQIVAPALNQQQIRGEPAVQGLQRVQVRADVFAHGGVGAAAGLDGLDARGREGGVPGEELGVLAREDVVGDGGDAVGVAQGEAEGEHEGGFAGADGAFAGEGVHVSRRGIFSLSPTRAPCDGGCRGGCLCVCEGVA